jgi:uncharacterized membrane protein
MPLFAGLLFIPLAYRCNSRVLFTLGAIAVTSALYRTIDLFPTNQVLQTGSVLVTVSIALLWAYSDQLWGSLLRRSMALPKRPFQPLARALGILSLGCWFYWFSFHYPWDNQVKPFDYRTSVASNGWLAHGVIGILVGLNPFRVGILARSS